MTDRSIGDSSGRRSACSRVAGAVDAAAAELTPLAGSEHGDRTEQIAELTAQLQQHPHDAESWFDLGSAYTCEGRFEDAVYALDCALAASPGNLGVQGALACALSGMGDLEEASRLFERVIQKDPGNGWAYLHLGAVRFQLNLLSDAVELWECSCRLLDDPTDSLENLAMAYRRLGDTETERRCWQRLSAFSADHPAVRHMLAAHGDLPPAERTDDAYLRHLFDRFAPNFDGVLQALDYRVPDLLEARLREAHGAPAGTLSILDAGCGTGLCGERLRPWAGHLTGVDISPGMLAKSRERDFYDELTTSELTAFLAPARSYDWIVAGDVLCYFGDLNGVVRAAVRCLAPGGRLFLTVEKDRRTGSSGESGHRLQSHGRYCHTRAHVEASARAAGGQVQELSLEILRHESGEPVEGFCVVLRAPA